MDTSKKMNCYTAGLIIFAMFFGAGNIFLPLALSLSSLDKTRWALAGFLITAIVIPMVGLFAMFLYQGNIRAFFSRLGRVPGFCLACLIIALLGPFGAAPRCITLAYSTISTSISGIPLMLFSAIFCSLIFCFSWRKSRLLKWIGYVLAPLKILLLIGVIIKGCIEAPEMALKIVDSVGGVHFLNGIKEGYNTMDLLAALFFAPILISVFSNADRGRSLSRFAAKAISVGALLLAIVYGGFCCLAYAHASELTGIPSDQLLGVISIKVLGPHAGLIMSLTIAVACLTTTTALIAAFTNFIQKELFKEKFNHVWVLVISLFMTFSVTTLKFQGIANLLHPILQVCYPVLIVLTCYNLFKPLPLTFGENRTQ